MEVRNRGVVSDPAGGMVREERRVMTDPAGHSEPTVAPVTDSAEVVSSFSPARRGVEAVYLVFGVIEGLLLIRVVLKLLGANINAGFTSFTYGVTDFFLMPFHNLLPAFRSSKSQLELSVLIAIIVYALIGWSLARLVTIMFSRNVTLAQRSVTRPPRY